MIIKLKGNSKNVRVRRLKRQKCRSNKKMRMKNIKCRRKNYALTCVVIEIEPVQLDNPTQLPAGEKTREINN